MRGAGCSDLPACRAVVAGYANSSRAGWRVRPGSRDSLRRNDERGDERRDGAGADAESPQRCCAQHRLRPGNAAARVHQRGTRSGTGATRFRRHGDGFRLRLARRRRGIEGAGFVHAVRSLVPAPVAGYYAGSGRIGIPLSAHSALGCAGTWKCNGGEWILPGDGARRGHAAQPRGADAVYNRCRNGCRQHGRPREPCGVRDSAARSGGTRFVRAGAGVQGQLQPRGSRGGNCRCEASGG